MKRTQLNFAIDAAAFAAFLLLLSTGLLLRYQLPPGSGGLHAKGMGRAAEQPVTLLWGWTRHDWGTVHYWMAGLLLAVLAIHLALHWKWIVCVVRGTRGDASGYRFGLGLTSLVALVLLAAAPVLAPTQIVTRGELRDEKPVAAAELRGSMSVADAAAAVGVSVDELLERLQLPSDTSPDEQMGRLLRRHDLQMSDVRQTFGSDE